jgi:hypothetical protein
VGAPLLDRVRETHAGRTGISFDRTNRYCRTNLEPIQIDPFHRINYYEIKLEDPDSDVYELGKGVTRALISRDGEEQFDSVFCK